MGDGYARHSIKYWDCVFSQGFDRPKSIHPIVKLRKQLEIIINPFGNMQLRQKEIYIQWDGC